MILVVFLRPAVRRAEALPFVGFPHNSHSGARSSGDGAAAAEEAQPEEEA